MRIPSSSTNKWSDTEKCDRLSYKEATEPIWGALFFRVLETPDELLNFPLC
jgi:hypothetical protein